MSSTKNSLFLKYLLHPPTHQDAHTEVGVGTSVATPPSQHPILPDSMPITNMPIIDTITPPIANVNEPSSQSMLEHA